MQPINIVDLHKYELSENSIQILDKQQLTENSVVIVKVDCGSLPAQKAKDYMENIRSMFTKIVEPAQVVIMPHTNSIHILEKEDYVNNK